MATIFVNLRQVTSNGVLLENIIPDTEGKIDLENLKYWWEGHERYTNVKVSRSKLFECLVCDGVIYLPSAVYGNYHKEQYIPAHWNVRGVA